MLQLTVIIIHIIITVVGVSRTLHPVVIALINHPDSRFALCILVTKGSSQGGQRLKFHSASLERPPPFATLRLGRTSTVSEPRTTATSPIALHRSPL